MKKHYIIIGSLAGVAAVLCVLIIFKGISQIITDKTDPSPIENTNVKNNKTVEISKNYENNENVENTESGGKPNNIEPSKNVENNKTSNGKGTNKGLIFYYQFI